MSDSDKNLVASIGELASAVGQDVKQIRTDVAGTKGEVQQVSASLENEKQVIMQLTARLQTVEGKVGQSKGAITLQGPVSGFIQDTLVYTITNYSNFSLYEVRANRGSASIQQDKITLTLPGEAGDVALIVSMDGAETEFTVRVKPAGVYAPRGTGPLTGTLIETPAVSLAASAFVPAGVPDVHASSDWQLASDPNFGTVLQSLDASTSSLTSWAVAGLQPSQTYYWRVRYRGVRNGVSDWSEPMTLQTASEFLGLVGEPGTQGFGVGVYPGELPEGFSEMEGTRNKASDNYGNYTYKDGSIMVFVPKFYYRFSHESSPRYAKYKMHAIDIAGTDKFGDEAAANAAGYVLHRAFKDGGQIKPGFFIDKYPAGFNENRTGVVSKKGLNPITGTYSGASTIINNLQSNKETKPNSIYVTAQMIWGARSRGVGVFHLPSVFMYTAIQFLTLAHLQTCTSTAYCAWYHETHNFPKGPDNLGGNRDSTDSHLTFTNGESFYISVIGRTCYKALTGSGNEFAKTTHNGQNSGVADLVMGFSELALGLTSWFGGMGNYSVPGEFKGDAFVLKETVKLSDLTYDEQLEHCVWKRQDKIQSMYRRVSKDYSSHHHLYAGATDFNTAVFSNEVSGPVCDMTSCGIPNKGTGLKVNLYRNTVLYPISSDGILLSFGGSFSNGSGLLHKSTATTTKTGTEGLSFRCATFGV